MKRVLLVEDDEDVRTLLEFVLRDAGHELDSARSVTGALEYIRMRPTYDLVLTDLRLGKEGNGGTIANAAADAGTRTIIATGYPPDVAEEDRADTKC